MVILSCQLSFYPLLITSAFLHKVRVVFLSVKSTIGGYEGKCIVHKTSIAAIIVCSVTVNELLLR